MVYRTTSLRVDRDQELRARILECATARVVDGGFVIQMANQGIAGIGGHGHDAAARLAGLLPGGLMVSALLTISVLAVSRLPATLFAAERKAAAD